MSLLLRLEMIGRSGRCKLGRLGGGLFEVLVEAGRPVQVWASGFEDVLASATAISNFNTIDYPPMLTNFA